MIELLIINFLLQSNSIFRWSLPANTMPWNTTGNYTLWNIPNIVTQNIPWFFPLITLVLLLVTDYEFGLRKGIDTKANFFAVALVYTILSYIEVLGGISTSGYFFVFEFVMILSLFIMTLFTGSQPGG